jgi:KpsF/GutQ family protein
LLATIKRLQVPVIAMTGDEICLPQGIKPSSARTGLGTAEAVPFQNKGAAVPPEAGRSARSTQATSARATSTKATSTQATSARATSARAASTAISTLAAAADVALDCSVAEEACALGLAPTASTTTMLALGDALAVTLSEKRGFKEEDFANLHPGGKLGKRLARVESLMHAGETLPCVAPHTKMPDVIYEMSRKKLGVTAVVEGERLSGIISDGDLRRLLEKRGKDALDLTAGEAMTRNPKTIGAGEFAATALARMEEKKITSLMVVDEDSRLLGIIHLHDLWGIEMI